MRTTLVIDDDVLDAARALARARSRSLGSVVSELARRGLSPPADPAGTDDLPGFDVPDDAPLFGPEDVARGLDEA